MEMQNHHYHHHFQPKALLPISFISSNGRMIKTTTTTAKDSGGNGDQHKYRECLKNHAASLGGHALDGCMEFMLSPTSTLSRPSSLTCAACGCHRNFHRRIPLLNQQEENGDKEGELEDEDEEDPFGSSGPHMLMALSAGGRTTTTTNTTPRKRFRTRFSKEQKEKMQELAVRLGWRMLKRDEGLVEEWCSEIGVGKHVFKVWMHNNKNSFRIINTNNTTDSPNDNHGVLPLLMGNGNGNGNNGCGVVSSPSTS